MAEYDISQIVTPEGDICNLKDIRIENIENNLTTTNTNSVLDARQGKALKDLIDSLTPASIGAKATQVAISDPTTDGTSVSFIDSISQDAQGVITPTKKTVRSATQSVSGLMSSTDKTKLDGIATGAQVNSITGVKGDAESSYRTGNVNLTAANIGAVAKSGDTVTGRLTFTTTNAIAYQGTKAWYDMIKFIDNTNDNYGNGITIGGAGAVIIGGGESADAAAAQLTTGGSEILYLCNDGDVNVYSNMQDGWASRKTFTFGANGTLTAPAFSGPLTGNVTGNCSGSSGSCTGNAANVTGTVAVAHGGTGATTAATARSNLGIVSAYDSIVSKVYFDTYCPGTRSKTLGEGTYVDWNYDLYSDIGLPSGSALLGFTVLTDRNANILVSMVSTSGSTISLRFFNASRSAQAVGGVVLIARAVKP